MIRFPGSCDELDALGAASRVGDATLLWHADRDLEGVDAVIVPGGFSYGDYLRAGAIARFSPVMEAVIEFAREGGLVLGDEALTPDSSRYWPAAGYEPGRGQPSFDKQFVRDWASASGWDKRPPAPAIPDEVVAGTRARYVEAYELITGEPFEEWLTRTDVVHAQGAA